MLCTGSDKACASIIEQGNKIHVLGCEDENIYTQGVEVRQQETTSKRTIVTTTTVITTTTTIMKKEEENEKLLTTTKNTLLSGNNTPLRFPGGNIITRPRTRTTPIAPNLGGNKNDTETNGTTIMTDLDEPDNEIVTTISTVLPPVVMMFFGGGSAMIYFQYRYSRRNGHGFRWGWIPFRRRMCCQQETNTPRDNGAGGGGVSKKPRKGRSKRKNSDEEEHEMENFTPPKCEPMGIPSPFQTHANYRKRSRSRSKSTDRERNSTNENVPMLEKSFSNPAYDPNASSVCGAEGGVQVHSMEDYIEPVKSRVEDLYYEGYLMSKKRVYGEDMYEKEEPNFFNRIYNALSILDPRQNNTSNPPIYTGGARPKSTKSKINIV